MKKAMKKLMAAMLAIAMVMAMAVPAFAADEAGSTNNGKITIDNAVTGMTYNVYRILNVDTHNSDYSSIVYKTNTKWKDFIETVKDTYFDDISEDGVVKVKSSLTEADAKNLAYSAKQWLDSHSNITADAEPIMATSKDVTFDSLPLGYYMVVSTGWDSSVNVVCSLDTTKNEVTIHEKNGQPTIDKEIIEDNNSVKQNDASIGDIVKFQTTVTVTDGNPLKYIVTDDMSAGLTFIGKNSTDSEHQLSVTVNGQSFTSDKYTVTEGGDHTFTVTFKDVDGKSVLNPNDVVVITYYAVVNENAVIAGTGNTNKTDLSYNDKPGNSSSTTTYVWKIDAYKFTTNADGNTEALGGAQFVLSKEVNGKTLYAIANADNKITGWTENAYDSAETEKATIFTSPDNGKFSIIGLDSGSYKLTEIKAPDGYNKLDAPIDITITYTVTGESATETVTYGNNGTGEVQIENKAGATLPSTGGIGTTIFYVIGGGLMIAAAVLLITKKRMENKN